MTRPSDARTLWFLCGALVAGCSNSVAGSADADVSMPVDTTTTLDAPGDLPEFVDADLDAPIDFGQPFSIDAPELPDVAPDACVRGSQGTSCGDEAPCLPGLYCASGAQYLPTLCLRCGHPGERCCVGQYACWDAGLTCVQDPASIDPIAPEPRGLIIRYCLGRYDPPGEAGGPCNPDGTCNSDDVMCSPSLHFCLPCGDIGEDCCPANSYPWTCRAGVANSNFYHFDPYCVCSVPPGVCADY